jgi:hypothetical protein
VELEFTDFGGLVRQGWRSKFRHLVDAPMTVASPVSAADLKQGCKRAG